jgi:aminoglycoside phosphotransferase (APT) family kinase protein
LSPHAVSLAEATEFLSSRFEGRVERVELIGGGDWSRAYGFVLDGHERVARFGEWREDFEADARAVSFRGPDLPVPEVIEIGNALGGAYAVSARHHGAFLESLSPARMESVAPAVCRAFDAMRTIELPVGEYRTSPWQEWLFETIVDEPGGRVSGWRARLAADADLDGLFRGAEAALREVAPACPDLRSVLHLDLLNRNVLVAVDGAPRLEAVFDWGCVAAGDPLYEVAWFTFWSPWHEGVAAVDWRALVRDHWLAAGVDTEAFDDRMRAYELHIALTHLAYCAFAPGRDADLVAVAARTRDLL